MVIHIDKPERFAGRPLLLKRAWPEKADDYVVMADGLTAGRIMQIDRSFQRRVWLWSLTGPYCNAPDLRLTAHGDADSLEDAKAAFKGAFRKWQTWAVDAAASGARVPWHE